MKNGSATRPPSSPRRSPCFRKRTAAASSSGARGGCSCALWAEDYEPKLYRCFSDGECAPDEAVRWMRGYAQSAGGEIAAENVRIFDADGISPAELQRAGEATFAASPSIAALDFSNSGASAAERRESFFASAFSALRAVTAAGVFCLALSLLLLVQDVFMKDSFASAPSEIYSLALGEESRAPLTSVTRRLRAVSGGGVQLSFDGVLAGVAAAWKSAPDTMRLDAPALRHRAHGARGPRAEDR